jgi:hypothetical protein
VISERVDIAISVQQIAPQILIAEEQVEIRMALFTEAVQSCVTPPQRHENSQTTCQPKRIIACNTRRREAVAPGKCAKIRFPWISIY